MKIYRIQEETLVNLANNARDLNGSNEQLTLEQIGSGLVVSNEEIEIQAELIEQIATALEGKAAGGEVVEITLQSKTVTPTTSVQTVTADSGYDGLDTVTVNAMPTATQATPSITVDANGKITASATQTAGYVVAGTKSATKQLTTQAAKTITPSTSSQTAVAKDVYTTGVVTVGAIPSNYIVPNGTLTITTNGTHDVKNYASATVNVAGSGGSSEDTEILNSLLNGTISSYSNNTMSKVRGGLFMDCGALSSINLPACQNIDKLAFRYCTQLKSVNFPVCSNVGESAFFYCTKLTSISFPQCKTIGSMAFAQCSQLQSVDLPECTTIYVSAFASCKSIATVNIPLCTTIYQQAFRECGMLTEISLPSVSNVSTSAFLTCTGLTTISLPNAQTLNNTAFQKCYNLKSLYLMGSSLCALKNSNVFTSTPIGGYSKSAGTYGSIYVPASMLASYQAATNWTYFSSRFVGVNDGLEDWEGEEENW